MTPSEKAAVIDLRAGRLVSELMLLIEACETLNTPVEPYHLHRLRNRLERLEAMQKESA